MKKIIALVLLIIILISFSYIYYTKNIENNIEKDYIQLNYFTTEEYFNTLSSILISNNISELTTDDTKIINNNLMDSLVIYYSDKNDIGEDNLTIDNNDDTNEYTLITDTNNKYPVIDEYGTIYKYGTKEESDKSYEIYNQLPTYKMLSSQTYNNSIQFKLINREIGVVQIYNIYIDELGYIDSFEVVR